MIFKQNFIDLILLGKKTQTRRMSRGIYKVGKDYAIQPCRTCKGIPNNRILMDDIWYELSTSEGFYIGVGDAIAEGGFTQDEFESYSKHSIPNVRCVTHLNSIW